MPCAPSGYERGFTGAPSAPWVRCEIGELKTDDVANVMAGMAGLDAPALQVPRGDAGVSRVLVRQAGVAAGAPQGEGSFRMTCTLAKMDFFDPIVYPGAANSSHLHMFFGNADITPSSTAANLSEQRRRQLHGWHRGTAPATGCRR